MVNYTHWFGPPAPTLIGEAKGLGGVANAIENVALLLSMQLE